MVDENKQEIKMTPFIKQKCVCVSFVLVYKEVSMQKYSIVPQFCLY